MSVLKDLLYTRGNRALDIARLSSAAAVASFLFIAIWKEVHSSGVSLTEFGAGWATVAAGCAAWIAARQYHEAKQEDL